MVAGVVQQYLRKPIRHSLTPGGRARRTLIHSV